MKNLQILCQKKAGFRPLLYNKSFKTYCNSASIDCLDWFAWASIEVAACDKIWFLVKLAVSAAKSASRIRLFAALVLVAMLDRLLIVWSNLFSKAPNLDLSPLTVVRAVFYYGKVLVCLIFLSYFFK